MLLPSKKLIEAMIQTFWGFFFNLANIVSLYFVHAHLLPIFHSLWDIVTTSKTTFQRMKFHHYKIKINASLLTSSSVSAFPHQSQFHFVSSPTSILRFLRYLTSTCRRGERRIPEGIQEIFILFSGTQYTYFILFLSCLQMPQI